MNADEGLRLLLSAPELNDLDWGTIMGFPPSDDSSAYPAAPPAAPGDARMTQLENRLVSLATSFHDLQRTLATQVAAAVSQALMAHSPPAPAAEPRTAARGPAAMDTAEDSTPE